PFDGGYHHAECNLLIVPATEISDAMAGKQLALEPEWLQWMTRNVEAEDLLFLGQSLGVGEGRDVRKRMAGERATRPGVGVAAEERHLARGALLLLERRFLEGAVENSPILRPMAADVVERARRNERFEHAFVAQTQINPLAEVVDRREWSLVAPRREDRID